MSTDVEKFFCLMDELETADKLIRAGFGALQEIDMENDFYHLPHQLMASGLERLMKCFISLAFEDANGTFPDMAQMKAFGHDLTALLDRICTHHYGGKNRPLVQEEFDFITQDTILRECVRILSLFGRFGRYYNLDVVAGSQHSPVDPKSEWETLESTVEDNTPYLSDPEALHRDYYPRVHAQLIAKLERLVRAIAFQFTIGDHPDTNGRLRQTSTVFSDFRNMKNDSLGTSDYRRSVKILRQRKHEWQRRSKDEIQRDGWPSIVVSKDSFQGEWPFRVDEIVIELQEELFCLASIAGYAFALNGTAASRFDLPFPHDAGLAILGKSVGPFTDMALALRDTTER